MCFAYYGRVDRFSARVEVIGANGAFRSSRRWEFWIGLDSERWKFTCLDLKQMFNDNSLMSHNGNKGIDEIGVTNIKISEIWVGNNPDENGEYRMRLDDSMLAFVENVDLVQAPVREAGIGMSDGRGVSEVVVYKSDDDNNQIQISFRRNYNSALKPEENEVCGWEVPEMKVLSINGEALTETVVSEKESVFENSDSSVRRQHASQPSKKWSGKIKIGETDFEASTATAEEIENVYSELGHNVDITMNEVCTSSYGMTVEWVDTVSPVPPFVNLTEISSGAESTNPTRKQLMPAGVWIQRATPNMLREASEVPKVTMNVGGSAVICFDENDCVFELETTDIAMVSVERVGNTIEVVLNENLPLLDIEAVVIGDVPCENLVVDGLKIICDIPSHVCGGENTVKVKKADFGYIIGSGTITTDFVLSSMSPVSGSRSGGTKVTLSGSGFCTKSQISQNFFIGNQQISLSKLEIVSNSQIVIIMPKQASGTAKKISLTGSLGKWFEFQEISVISQVDADLNVFGGVVTITGTNFGEAQGDSECILSGDSGIGASDIVTWSDTEVIAEFSALEVGTYEIELNIEDVGSAKGDFMVEVKIEISQIYPENASFYGRETVEIHGEGFGNNSDEVDVKVGQTKCEIISISNEFISCKTGKIDHSVTVYPTGQQVNNLGQTQPNFNNAVVRLGQSIKWCFSLSSAINFEIFETGETSLWRSQLLSNVKTGCIEKVFDTIGVFSFETEYLDSSNSLKFHNDVEVIESEEKSDKVVVSVAGFEASFSYAELSKTDICYTDVNTGEYLTRSVGSTPFITNWTEQNMFVNETIDLSFTSASFVQNSDFCITVELENSLVNCQFKSLENNIYTCSIVLSDAQANNLIPHEMYTIKVSTTHGKAVFVTNNPAQFWFEPEISSVNPSVGSLNGGTKVTVVGAGIGYEGVRVSLENVEVSVDLEASNYNTLVFETPENEAGHLKFEIILNGEIVEIDFEYAESATVNLGIFEEVAAGRNEITISASNLPENVSVQDLKVQVVVTNQPQIVNQHQWTYFEDLRVYYKKDDGNTYQNVVNKCRTLQGGFF